MYFKKQASHTGKERQCNSRVHITTVFAHQTLFMPKGHTERELGQVREGRASTFPVSLEEKCPFLEAGINSNTS